MVVLEVYSDQCRAADRFRLRPCDECGCRSVGQIVSDCHNYVLTLGFVRLICYKGGG